MKSTLVFLLTALPLIAQDSILNLRKYVPQLVDGTGWQTTFTLINGQDGPAAGMLRFFDSAGSPMTMPVRVGASVQNVESIGLVALTGSKQSACGLCLHGTAKTRAVPPLGPEEHSYGGSRNHSTCD